MDIEATFRGVSARCTINHAFPEHNFASPTSATISHGYRRLPGSLTSRGFTGSGFQPAMVRAHCRACAIVRHAREQATELDRGSKLATLVERGADGGGLCLGDDEHHETVAREPRSARWERRAEAHEEQLKRATGWRLWAR